ncbi:universal stress protein [Parasphingorhabdus pacifica]
MTEADPIVVGVDGTPAGVRALRWAIEEARLRHLPVRAITVCPPAPDSSRQSTLEPYEAPMRGLSGSVRACLVGEPLPHLRAELLNGRAADVLVACSDRAALLVLGDHGRNLWDAEPLGGTAWECIHRARCPVLVVPAETRERVTAPTVNDPVLD